MTTKKQNATKATRKKTQDAASKPSKSTTAKNKDKTKIALEAERRRHGEGLEERLDRKIKQVLKTGPADNLPEQWISLRELHRVELLYPGKFVAFLDHHEGGDYHRRLVKREVFCTAKTLLGLHRKIVKLGLVDLCGLHVTFVEPPGTLPFLWL